MEKDPCSRRLTRVRAAACAAMLLAFLCLGLRTVARNRSLLEGVPESPEAFESELTGMLSAREAVLAPSRMVNDALQRRFFEESKILVTPEGMMLQGSDAQSIEPALENIDGLYRYCRLRGMRFLYAILPGKPGDDADLTSWGVSCARNATADAIRDGLLERGIPCVDIREAFAGDFYEMFYRTDHHWTADGGLRAAGCLLEALNERFGYHFDLSRLSPERFERKVLPESWVGEMGKKVLGGFARPDDLVLLTPSSPVRLTCKNLQTGKTRSGGFDILTDPDKLEGIDGMPYYYYLSGNETLELVNPDADEGDLVIVKDSFANAMLPFMALDAARITAWDMRRYPCLYDYLDAHPETETVVVAYTISFMPTSYMNDFQRSESGNIFAEDPAGVEAAPQMEYLNRGTVAVKVPEGVFLSWRLLGTEAYDTAFTVLRNGSPIAEVGDCTCYVDSEGGEGDTYAVLAAGDDGAAAETVSVWASARLSIPLEPPPSGIGADGEPYDYSAGDAACADLDGDGAYELLLKWDPSNAFDSGEAGRPTGSVYLDAYALDGRRLWRMDLGVNIPAGAHFTQISAYDFDLDGKAELAFKTAPGTRDAAGRYVSEVSLQEEIRSVDNTADLRHGADGAEDFHGRALSGAEFYTVFQGDTGEALDTVPYPHPRGSVSEWGDDRGNRSERYLAAVAYLDGQHPCAVTWRGYYGKTTAAAYRLIDKRLVLAADFDSSVMGGGYEGQGNHNLAVADVDGDGRDEILCGSLALDDDFSVLWCSGRGHGDALHLADYDPEHPGLEYFSVHEIAPYGMTLYDAATGRELFHRDADSDTGRGMMAHVGYTDGYFELWCTASGVKTDGDAHIDTFASVGEADVRPADFLPASTNFRLFWDGDLYDDLLDGTEDGGLRVDNRDGLLCVLPGACGNNGSKNNACLTADLFGDWREEVVARSADSRTLWIYTSVAPTRHRLYTLMHDRAYRMQVAAQNAGYNQPPHLGYYVSDDVDEWDQRAEACRVRTVHDGETRVRGAAEAEAGGDR